MALFGKRYTADGREYDVFDEIKARFGGEDKKSKFLRESWVKEDMDSAKRQSEQNQISSAIEEKKYSNQIPMFSRDEKGRRVGGIADMALRGEYAGADEDEKRKKRMLQAGVTGL